MDSGFSGKFKVSPEKETALRGEMKRLGIREADLEEKFIRAAGPGGQKVNKTSSCVYLRHLPSGLEVKCQQERSQALNRYRARKILTERFAAQIRREHTEKQKELAKIRKQKRKRSKRAKEKMLSEKKIQGEKKRLRGRVQREG